jgi:hypothetical protein
MDWFKQNPFLGVLAAATGVAVLASGYFLFNGLGRYQAAAQEFEEQTMTLQRLQENKPFPNEENVRRSREELDGARKILEEIGQSLQVAAPPTTPQAFQDLLREKVNDIVARAAANNVALGEGFYLGFQAYETQPPASTAAASQLALQLQSIHTVASILVDAKVREISGIARAALPAEAPGGQAKDDTRRGRGPQAAETKDDALPDLVLAPFDINFLADQAALRAALNRILDVTPPVFVRLVGVSNSAPTAPAKGAEAEEAAGSEATIKPVLGQEAILVNLRLAAISSGPTEND